jgi:hypothetical protein
MRIIYTSRGQNAIKTFWRKDTYLKTGRGVVTWGNSHSSKLQVGVRMWNVTSQHFCQVVEQATQKLMLSPGCSHLRLFQPS